MENLNSPAAAGYRRKEKPRHTYAAQWPQPFLAHPDGEPPEAGPSCPHCGAEVALDDRACPECGGTVYGNF